MTSNNCVHKYLTVCKTNPQPPGFGDFLRGTIALFNFSKKYNFNLLIDYNHPIFQFLEPIHKNNYHYISTDVIELLPPLSYDQIYNYSEQLFINGASFIIMTNSFYTKDDNNNLINYGKITEECREFLIHNILTPSKLIEDKIEYLFNNVYKLNPKQAYRIVQLRMGDIFIHKNIFDDNKYNFYYDKVKNIVSSSDMPVILISDSAIISKKLKENIEGLYYWDNLKIHLGDLQNNSPDSILETLIDYFIMSRSKEIISNGSGFSTSVSDIFGIKYIYF